MTNREKALALTNTFASGDNEKAKEPLTPGYIQHNLTYGTDVDTSVGSVAHFASGPVKTTVSNIRAFEDEDKVFSQTVYNFAGTGKQVAFDIFHFNTDDKVVGHWDNLAVKVEPDPSGHMQVDGYDFLGDLDKTEENRELIKNFLNGVMQGKAPEKALSYFDGDTCVQYNADITDGLSGLGVAFEALGKQGTQMIYDTVHQVLAEGNYVLVVSERGLGGTPTSYCGLWRTKDSKTAEYQDVIETIIEKDTRQNQDDKFQYNYPNYVRLDVEWKAIQKLMRAGLRNRQISESSSKEMPIMTAKSYLECIAREIHTTIVATADDEGLPITAAIDMVAADGYGLYFLTAKGKGFYDHLVKRQYPALMTLKDEDTMSCVAVSTRGKVHELEDERIPKLLKLNPYMRKTYSTEESMQVLTVFQIYEGSNECFDLSRKPIEGTSFTFGGAEKRAEGYFTTDTCISCGSCMAVCPQDCILTERISYIIEREHCLHCGDCLTICPIGAVERRAHTVPGTAVLRRTG